MSKKLVPAISLALTTFLLLGSGCASLQPTTMAKVNDDIITVKAFKERMGDFHTIKDIGKKMDAKIRVVDYEGFLLDMVDERLMIQEAKRVGFKNIPKYQSAYDGIELNIFVELLKEDEIKGKVVVTDEEIQKEFVHQFETVKLRHFFAKKKEKGERILKALQEGANFEEMVVKESEDPPGLIDKKGDLGFRTRKRLKKELADVAFTLNLGEVSGLIESKIGYHIITKTDAKIPELKDTYEKSRIYNKFFQQRAKVREAELLATLKEKNEVVIDQTIFEKIKQNTLEKGANPVLATLNGNDITVSDFFFFEKQLRRDKNKPYDVQVQETWDSFIEKKMYRIEAVRRDYSNDSRFKVLISDLTDILYLDYFKAYMVAELSNLIPSEVKDYYDNNREKFKLSKQVKVRVIHLEDIALAKRILSDIQNGGNFSTWAKEKSLDKNTAAKGGKLGWLDLDKMPFMIREDFPDWKSGGVYGPYEIGKDVFVLKYDEERKGTYKKYKDVKEDIITEMLKFKYAKNMNSYLSELRSLAKVTVNRKQLDAYIGAKRRVFEAK